jgi:hypothetical protein
MGGWLLEVPEFDGADHWRWRLTDPDGAEVAVHQVALDPGTPEYEGFVDLAGHLRRRADPDRRAGSEAELVERVGAWAGARVLGRWPSRSPTPPRRWSGSSCPPGRRRCWTGRWSWPTPAAARSPSRT